MGEQNKIGALLATAEPLDSLRSADRKKVLKGGVKTIEYFMYVRKSKSETLNETPYLLIVSSSLLISQQCDSCSLLGIL